MSLNYYIHHNAKKTPNRCRMKNRDVFQLVKKVKLWISTKNKKLFAQQSFVLVCCAQANPVHFLVIRAYQIHTLAYLNFQFSKPSVPDTWFNKAQHLIYLWKSCLSPLYYKLLSVTYPTRHLRPDTHLLPPWLLTNFKPRPPWPLRCLTTLLCASLLPFISWPRTTWDSASESTF